MRIVSTSSCTEWILSTFGGASSFINLLTQAPGVQLSARSINICRISSSARSSTSRHKDLPIICSFPNPNSSSLHTLNPKASSHRAPGLHKCNVGSSNSVLELANSFIEAGREHFQPRPPLCSGTGWSPFLTFLTRTRCKTLVFKAAPLRGRTFEWLEAKQRNILSDAPPECSNALLAKGAAILDFSIREQLASFFNVISLLLFSF
mmetsp:Transcript_1157/g.1626  ORF Transcript_1157/g.1626 Transcript_1157/m.1626 type:complete len:206 (+) Transcript_1157:540-1157(+)